MNQENPRRTEMESSYTLTIEFPDGLKIRIPYSDDPRRDFSAELRSLIDDAIQEHTAAQKKDG